jgi:hypothetical protein
MCRSNLVDQRKRRSANSLWEVRLCLRSDSGYLMLPESVVLQWLRCFSRIDRRGEDVVQLEFTWKYVFCNMRRLFRTACIGEPIENIWYRGSVFNFVIS